MKLIKQRVAGRLLAAGGRVAVRLGGSEEPAVYLAYALVTQGIAAQILPALLLDDWGNEIKGLRLYDWVRENGLHFPRAEVFGLTPAGAASQYFLRDMELFAPTPVYAATDKAAPIQTWLPVQAVLLPDVAALAPEPATPPDDMHGPLRVACVSWWRVPTYLDDLAFIDERAPLGD